MNPSQQDTNVLVFSTLKWTVVYFHNALLVLFHRWANHIAKNNVLKHSNDRDGAGENLAWGSRDLSAEEAAKMWYDEIKDYNFKKPGFSGSTGKINDRNYQGR